MASILIVDPDRSWCRQVGRRLLAEGQLIAHAGTWSEGVGRLLRERSDLLVLSMDLPDVSVRELCIFLRSRSALQPTVVLRLPADPDAREVLEERAHGLTGVDATLDNDLAPEAAAEVLAALAASLRREAPGIAGRRPLRADLVLVAGRRPGPSLGSVLRTAGLRVAEAVDLDGLARLLASLDHDGPVFVDQELLEPDEPTALRRLRRASPEAVIFVVGEAPRQRPPSSLGRVRWIPADCQPISLLSAALLSGSRAGPQGAQGGAEPGPRAGESSVATSPPAGPSGPSQPPPGR